jgi:hypothetical protein
MIFTGAPASVYNPAHGQASQALKVTCSTVETKASATAMPATIQGAFFVRQGV